MLESRPLRRVLAAGAAAGIAAGLALFPAGGAYAGVKTQYLAGGSANSNYTGSDPSGSCDINPSDTQDPQSPTKIFSDGTKRASVDLSVHFTNSVNTADTVHVKGHLDSKLTVVKKGRNLRSFDLGAGGSVKVVHSIAGSDCQSSGTVLGESAMKFTEHKKGYFYLTRDTTKPGSVVIFVMENLKTQKLVTFEEFVGDKSHATSRALLTPGTYAILEMGIGLTAGDNGAILRSGAPSAPKVSLSMSLQGEFKPKR